MSQLDHLAPTTSPTENRFNTFTQIGQFLSPFHHFLVNYLVALGCPMPCFGHILGPCGVCILLQNTAQQEAQWEGQGREGGGLTLMYDLSEPG